MPKIPAMREVDEAFLEVSHELAEEEFGGRRRKVWYRLRLKRANRNPNIGQPGDADQVWQRIEPNPVTSDGPREYSMERVGQVLLADLELRVDRLAIDRKILEASEFYIDDDPDGPEPSVNTSANYSLLEGTIQEGGGGVRERYRSWWVCLLRKLQTNAR